MEDPLFARIEQRDLAAVMQLRLQLRCAELPDLAGHALPPSAPFLARRAEIPVAGLRQAATEQARYDEGAQYLRGADVNIRASRTMRSRGGCASIPRAEQLQRVVGLFDRHLGGKDLGLGCFGRIWKDRRRRWHPPCPP